MTARATFSGAQDNRDKRVELLQKYAFKFFPSTKYLNYAVQVENYTLQKAANLVLNVDGCIGTLFLDLLHSSSLFTEVCIPVPSRLASFFVVNATLLVSHLFACFCLTHKLCVLLRVAEHALHL